MTQKQKFLLSLLSLILGLTILAGLLWCGENYCLVDFHLYSRQAETLDLRGQEVTAAHVEELQKKLPQCEILWEVPFQDGTLSSDTADLTITSLSEEDIVQLDYLTNLQTVEADGCRDYAALLALEQRRPEVMVSYRIHIGDDIFDRDAARIQIFCVTSEASAALDCFRNLNQVTCTGGEEAALLTLQSRCREKNISFSVMICGQELTEAVTTLELEGITEGEISLLSCLPNLARLHLILPQTSPESMGKLAQLNPQITITWEQEVFGKRNLSTDTELDWDGGTLTELSRLEEVLAWFPNAETVFLGLTDFDNEVLAQWREDHRQEYKLVWTVTCGEKLTVRTDATSFMPVKHNVYYFNDEEAYNLRYCEDMVCIDIGHMSIHNIDFVEYMPNLTYLVLAHTQLQAIEPIRSCKNLKFLELDWSPIQDLSPLADCTALEDLNLGNTFADFTPIESMTWLKNLWVIHCKSGTAYRLSQALPDTKVQGAGDATVASGWRDLPNYYAMRDELGMYYMSW